KGSGKKGAIFKGAKRGKKMVSPQQDEDEEDDVPQAHPGYRLMLVPPAGVEPVTPDLVAQAFNVALSQIGIDGEAEVDSIPEENLGPHLDTDLTEDATEAERERAQAFHVALVEAEHKADPEARMREQEGLQVYVMVDEPSGDKYWMDELVVEHLKQNFGAITHVSISETEISTVVGAEAGMSASSTSTASRGKGSKKPGRAEGEAAPPDAAYYGGQDGYYDQSGGADYGYDGG
ncbi:unnamed protein product, partial [Amoebophrya sp. A25]